MRRSKAFLSIFYVSGTMQFVTNKFSNWKSNARSHHTTPLREKTSFVCIALALFLAIAPVSFAGQTCPSHLINPISDVDWDGMFPISIANTISFGGSNPDTENGGSPICACRQPTGFPPVRVGIPLGFWEPFALIEVVRKSGCFPSLAGLQLTMGKGAQGGAEIRPFEKTGQGHAFYHVHYYQFPVLELLNMGLNAICLSHGDIALGWLTELDPTWNDDQLASILNPEAGLFANPIAQESCIIDALSSQAGHPLNAMFWCAGAQGSMYPLSGNVTGASDPSRAALLLAERVMFKLHRQHMVADTNNKDLCHSHFFPILPKTRYRYQLVYPNRKKAQPFGQILNKIGVNRPISGEDFVFLVFRKRNCCAF